MTPPITFTPPGGIIEDNAEFTFSYTMTVGGVVSFQTVYKPGTPGFNLQTLTQRAGVALTNNDAFLAIGSPSQAQALAQVQALTRQVNALIRIQLNALSDVTDS